MLLAAKEATATSTDAHEGDVRAELHGQNGVDHQEVQLADVDVLLPAEGPSPAIASVVSLPAATAAAAAAVEQRDGVVFSPSGALSSPTTDASAPQAIGSPPRSEPTFNFQAAKRFSKFKRSQPSLQRVLNAPAPIARRSGATADSDEEQDTGGMLE